MPDVKIPDALLSDARRVAAAAALEVAGQAAAWGGGALGVPEVIDLVRLSDALGPDPDDPLPPLRPLGRTQLATLMEAAAIVMEVAQRDTGDESPAFTRYASTRSARAQRVYKWVQAVATSSVAPTAEEPTATRAIPAPLPAPVAEAQVGTYVSVAEAAKALGVHPATVRRYVHAGSLPGKVFGNAVRVHRSALEPDPVEQGAWSPIPPSKPRPGPRGEFAARLRSIGGGQGADR